MEYIYIYIYIKTKKKLRSFLLVWLIHIKVLKPGPDRIVRPEKPRIAHFCGSLSLKNPFMAKKIGTRENRG